jgi:hypothetical protein
MAPESEKFTRRQAAKYLEEKHRARASPATLAKWASRGEGPPYRYFGKFAIYDAVDLDAWAAEKLSGLVHSTAGNPNPPKPRRQPVRTPTPLGRLYP